MPWPSRTDGAGPLQNMNTKKPRPFVVLPVLLFLFFVSLLLLANSLIQKPSVQKRLLQSLSNWTGYEIRAGEIEVYLWNGIGISVRDFEAHQREGFGEIRASQSIVFLDALRLLRGDVVPRRLHVVRPAVDLAPLEASGARQTKIEESLFALLVLPGFDSLVLEKAVLFIRDFPVRFVNLNLELKRRGADALTVKGQGEARLKRASAPFLLQGTMTGGQNKEKRPALDLSLETGPMPLRWIPFPEELPVTGGACDARLRIETKSGEPAKVSGRILVQSPRFSVREKGRTKDYAIEEMGIELRSFIDRGMIHVPYLTLKMPEASFSMSLRLDLREKDNPYLRLEGQSLLMPHSTVAALFPAPLVAAWVEKDLFPLLRSGDVRLESFLIDGKVSQLKKLELPGNEAALAMGFDCKNFTLHGDRLREPLKDVSAKVALKDGVLLVSELKGVSGKSEIRNGLLKVEDVFHPHPAFESWVQGSFDLEEVLYALKADGLSQGFKSALDKTGSLTGTVEGGARFRYHASMESPEITEADLRLSDLTVKRNHWPASLVMKQGRLQIRGERGTPSQAGNFEEWPWPESRGRFQGSGTWGASSYEAEGFFEVKGLNAEPQRIELVVDLDAGQAWSLLSSGWSPAEFKGSVLCRSTITRDADWWSIKGTAVLRALAVDHELFLMQSPGDRGRVTFDFDLLPEKQVRVRHLLWKIGESALTLSGNYPLSLESDATLRCSFPSLFLQDLGIHQKPGGPLVQGALKGDLQARIPKKNPSNALVSGELKGERLSFASASFPSPIRECSFSAIFSEQKILLPSFTMMTGESSLNGKGELRGWNGLKGEWTVTASPFDLSDFIPPSKKDRDKKELSSFEQNTWIRFRLNAQPARWKNIRSEKLNADLHLRKGVLHIADSEIHLDRGVLKVIGYVKEDKMAFSAHGEFKDQPVETLLSRLGIEQSHEGSLTLEAHLNTHGRELRDLLSHLDGGANVLIQKGVIRKSGVLLKILDFLSLQNIFTKRPPDLSKEGLYFESLGGHVKMEQGVARSENLQMRSPVLNAVGTGEADLGKGWVDLDLGVQPLGTIDTVVSNIPILGHILTGDNRSLITYYFEVKGPILNPEVEHVPFKNLGSGAVGVLKRLFLSPVRLFEDISKGLKSLPSPENGMETTLERSGP